MREGHISPPPVTAQVGRGKAESSEDVAHPPRRQAASWRPWLLRYKLGKFHAEMTRKGWPRRENIASTKNRRNMAFNVILL